MRGRFQQVAKFQVTMIVELSKFKLNISGNKLNLVSQVSTLLTRCSHAILPNLIFPETPFV